MFVFLDLETSGLRPCQDKILEIAILIADKNLNEVAHYTSIINHRHSVHFDREFLKGSSLLSCFNHRNIEMAKMLDKPYCEVQPSHRALEDCQYSLEQMRYYAKNWLLVEE